MGAKNCVLKNNNTLSNKNEGNTIQHVFKVDDPVNFTDTSEKPIVPRSKVDEKSHENAGSVSKNSVIHLNVNKILNVGHEDFKNLKFGVKVDAIAKKSKETDDSKSSLQCSTRNTRNDQKAEISESRINKSQIDLGNNKDTARSKYGGQKEKETHGCYTNSSNIHTDKSQPSNLNDELSYLIFGEHFSSCQHPASERLHLSLSEEILNYVDRNQWPFYDSESGFVKKCFLEGRFKNGDKHIKRFDVLDKACSTNPNLNTICPSSLNVAFVKGMIYRRELYGPRDNQAGQAGPSQPQVPVGTEEYVITKKYSYGKDPAGTKIPGFNQTLGCSCAGPWGNDLGMRSTLSSKQLPSLNNSQMEEQSNKNVIKLTSDTTEKKKVKLKSQKSSNKKVSVKNRSLMKTVISKKVSAKKTPISAKPKSLSSLQRTPSKIKKSLKNRTTPVNMPPMKAKKSPPAKNVVSSENDVGRLPSSTHNFSGCTCPQPWDNNFKMCPPCPPKNLPFFNQRPMEEKSCRIIKETETPDITDVKKDSFNKSIESYKKTSKTKNVISRESDDKVRTPKVKNNEHSEAVNRKKKSTTKKPNLNEKKSNKIIKKHNIDESKNGKKMKNMSSKSKILSPREIDVEELPSKLTSKTKIKIDNKSTDNDVNVIKNHKYLLSNSEKEWASKKKMDVKKVDKSDYDIRFTDNGDVKVKVEQFISGKNRVFTYNSINEADTIVDEKDAEEKDAEEKDAEEKDAEEKDVEEKDAKEKDAKGKPKDVKIIEISSPQKNKMIVDSQKQGNKMNIKIRIPKSLVNESIRTKSSTVDESKLTIHPSHSFAGHETHRTPGAQHDYSFLHPSASVVSHKQDYTGKDTIINYDEPVTLLRDSELHERLHSILEKLHFENVGSPEDPNYTAEVHTDKCIVKENKIECLTSIPNVKVVFDLPVTGTHGKYRETVKSKIARNDIHEVELDRTPAKSGEDGHYTNQANVEITDKNNQFDESYKLNSNLYDANKLLEIKEYLSKMKSELKNDCPCLVFEDKDKDRKNDGRKNNANQDLEESKKQSKVVERYPNMDKSTTKLSDVQVASKNNVHLKENDASNKFKFQKKQQTGTVIQEQHGTFPKDDLTTNKKYNTGNKTSELSGENKNRSNGTRKIKKFSQGSLTIHHPKNTITATKKSQFDAASDTKEYHKGKHLSKVGIPHNNARLQRTKIEENPKEWQSNNVLNSRKQKEYLDRKEILPFSGRPQKKTESNKFIDVSKAEASNPKSVSRKLSMVGRLKNGKTSESKSRIRLVQNSKKNQELKRANGVEKVWADHRLEKTIRNERLKQAKILINSRCCPDMAMKCCRPTICPPNIVICQYRCP